MGDKLLTSANEANRGQFLSLCSISTKQTTYWGANSWCTSSAPLRLLHDERTFVFPVSSLLLDLTQCSLHETRVNRVSLLKKCAHFVLWQEGSSPVYEAKDIARRSTLVACTGHSGAWRKHRSTASRGDVPGRLRYSQSELREPRHKPSVFPVIPQ